MLAVRGKSGLRVARAHGPRERGVEVRGTRALDLVCLQGTRGPRPGLVAGGRRVAIISWLNRRLLLIVFTLCAIL